MTFLDSDDPRLAEADRAEKLAEGYEAHAADLIQDAGIERQRARRLRAQVSRESDPMALVGTYRPATCSCAYPSMDARRHAPECPYAGTAPSNPRDPGVAGTFTGRISCGPRTPDSPRWCEHCQAWGNHHTDRCAADLVPIPAEAMADLLTPNTISATATTIAGGPSGFGPGPGQARGPLVEGNMDQGSGAFNHIAAAVDEAVTGVGDQPSNPRDADVALEDQTHAEEQTAIELARVRQAIAGYELVEAQVGGHRNLLDHEKVALAKLHDKRRELEARR